MDKTHNSFLGNAVWGLVWLGGGVVMGVVVWGLFVRGMESSTCLGNHVVLQVCVAGLEGSEF